MGDVSSPRGRIARNKSGTFDVYVGRLHRHEATVRTQREAKEVIDSWHDLHPEEAQAERSALLYSIQQLLREGEHEGASLSEAIAVFESHYGREITP